MIELELLDMALTKGCPNQERNTDTKYDCETSLMSDHGLVLFHGCAAKKEAKHNPEED